MVKAANFLFCAIASSLFPNLSPVSPLVPLPGTVLADGYDPVDVVVVG